MYLQWATKVLRPCSLSRQQPSYVPREARRYLVIKGSHVQVFHFGNHTCAVKRPPQSSTKEGIKENPRKLQLQSKKVDKKATVLLNTKWISNRKQEVTEETEPYGHNFEAVVHFKQNCDENTRFTFIHKRHKRKSR